MQEVFGDLEESGGCGYWTEANVTESGPCAFKARSKIINIVGTLWHGMTFTDVPRCPSSIFGCESVAIRYSVKSGEKMVSVTAKDYGDSWHQCMQNGKIASSQHI